MNLSRTKSIRLRASKRSSKILDKMIKYLKSGEVGNLNNLRISINRQFKSGFGVFRLFDLVIFLYK